MVALTQAPSVLWHLARAAGFVSLLLLAATVCVGVALSLRLRTPRWPTFVTEGLHRYLSTVLLVFLTIHVGTLLLDPFAKFSVQDVLIPFVSTYRTFWMALGICAAELVVAFALSIYIRRLIGYRAWRVLHYGTYALFPLSLLHGIGTGTDTHSWWGAAIYIVAGLPVTLLVFWRASLGGSGSGAASTEALSSRPVTATSPPRAVAQRTGQRR
jgi:methionine sulfoxide reductase heme-binding subunit